ncbi:AAA family ATPase [Bradyrhizobium sp. JR3.5]
MKIRSIELTNFCKFVGTIRVDNIGDNVNVLVGRNELGKSTLLKAINGATLRKGQVDGCARQGVSPLRQRHRARSEARLRHRRQGLDHSQAFRGTSW